MAAQLLLPAEQSEHVAVLHQRIGAARDPDHGLRGIACREQVFHATGPLLAIGIPVRGTTVQFTQPVGRLAPEALLQVVPEEVGVRMEFAVRIERADELLLLQPVQQPGAVGAAGHRSTERRRKVIEDRRVEHELQQLVGEQCAQLIEEAADVTRGAGDRTREFCGLPARADRQRGNSQRGRPALGEVEDGGELVRCRALPAGELEEFAGLFAGESQLRGIDLEDLAHRAQGREPDGRLRPRQQDQPQIGRGVAQQEAHALVDPRVVEAMDIIQEQEKVVAAVGDRIDHAGLQVVERRHPDRGAVERDRTTGASQGLDEVAQETAGFVVLGLERQPGHSLASGAQGLDPGQGQRGLAIASRRADHGHEPLGSLRQQHVEARTRDALRGSPWRTQLRLDDARTPRARWRPAHLPGPPSRGWPNRRKMSTLRVM